MLPSGKTLRLSVLGHDGGELPKLQWIDWSCGSYTTRCGVVCRIMSAVDDSHVSIVTSASSICGALYGRPSFRSLWHQSSHPSLSGRMIDKYLDRRLAPRRQWKLVGIAVTLIAGISKGSVLQRCRFSSTSRPMCTPGASFLKCRLGYLPPWNSASRRPRLPIS